MVVGQVAINPLEIVNFYTLSPCERREYSTKAPPLPGCPNHVIDDYVKQYNYESTVEPRYNEVLGTMKITLLYQVSHYIRVKKQRNIKSWDHQNYLVIRGFCYIRPVYNEVPLYLISLYTNFPLKVVTRCNIVSTFSVHLHMLPCKM